MDNCNCIDEQSLASTRTSDQERADADVDGVRGIQREGEHRLLHELLHCYCA